MPICNKTLPDSNCGNKSAAEIDDHASEAAKMKRTREQAYFNSYDFDAIEVLPYDTGEEDDSGEKDHSHRRCQAAAINNNFSTLPPPSLSPDSRQRRLQHVTGKHSTMMTRKICHSTSSGTGSTGSSSSSSAHHHERIKMSYLQRLGNFFSNQPQRSPAAIVATVSEMHEQQRTGGSIPGENILRSSGRYGQSSHDDVVGKTTASAAAGVRKVENETSTQQNTAELATGKDGGNFLLPRAILKYQSGVGNSNSMPLAVIAGTAPTTAAAAATTHAGTTNSLQNANKCRQNNAFSKSNNSNSSMVAATLRPSNSSCSNKLRQNQQSHLNSNEIGTGFQMAGGKSANNTARNNKSSIATTATPTTASTLTLATTASTSSATSVELSISENATMMPIANGNGGGGVGTSKLTKMVKTTTAASGPTTKAVAAIATSTHGDQSEHVSSHQSHYSTDKSGSSGYYSSNVCSTYSIEDHIYCEPVVDVLDLNSKSKSVLTSAGNSNGNGNGNINKVTSKNSKSTKITLEQSEMLRGVSSGGRTKIMNAGIGQTAGDHLATRDAALEVDCDADEDDEDDEDDLAEEDKQIILRTIKRNPAPPIPLPPTSQPTVTTTLQSPHFSENLRILETSIENLDRHLKAFPNLTSQDRITSFVQAVHYHQQQHQRQHQQEHHDYVPHGLEERFRVYPTQKHLPTIMEGGDPANSPTPNLWPDLDVADDSLLDIDLDSFLLVNERDTLGKRKQMPVGIDNPSFIAEELEENNYKCAKYINSCPEDAYRVESDIVAGGVASQQSASMEHYLKRYEDQIHFQSTRELLEDVRDKIRLLSRSRNELRSSSESSQGGAVQHKPTADVDDDDDELPKELDIMIKTLKVELESYLQRMNQHSELEIRQLCSGLVKNQNIVKMKKAFERRRSSIASLSALESDYDFSAYEAIRDGEIVLQSSASSAAVRQQLQFSSIRCASDPNFKMKRKSLTEIFPASDFYVENIMEVEHQQQQRIMRGGGGTLVCQTQLQRNLSFHQPVLDMLNTQFGPRGIGGGTVDGNRVDSGLTNSGRSSGSGGESGEKDSIMEWHRKKPSIWEMYYGTNRMNQSLLGKRGIIVNTNQAALSYPSSRPESDFTLDLPRAEQLRIKMEKEKKFRQRCRYITSFLSLVFFLLTVMVVSLVLTRGKRMFGSMI